MISFTILRISDLLRCLDRHDFKNRHEENQIHSKYSSYLSWISLKKSLRTLLEMVDEVLVLSDRFQIDLILNIWYGL